MAHTTTATPGRPSWAHDDFLLPPPNPAQRVNLTLPARDVHRLELHAALTTAGVAPMPGDREAIDHLSTLPDHVHTALHRWLTHATQ
ncbi:hypothetical protein [Streptomyces sp. DH10]|uniref:hypothetical protein n=1 Tax=Streptomyces sp. DH10 TaxID=3040121 RepID=UPI002441B5E1|nr:hypothetical protein [Streptomyces sp. DH10]MDG9709279.1 hypothetical protein [Streptomyces sp. DH10]